MAFFIFRDPGFIIFRLPESAEKSPAAFQCTIIQPNVADFNKKS